MVQKMYIKYALKTYILKVLSVSKFEYFITVILKNTAKVNKYSIFTYFSGILA